MPGMPQNVDGMRMEPAPSVPTASGPMPEATAAAAPPEEPPGVIFVFQGLRVMPVSRLSVVPLMPNSGVFVLPSSTAPGLAQPRGGRRVDVPRLVRIDGPRAAQRRPAAREDQVLDRDGHAVEEVDRRAAVPAASDAFALARARIRVDTQNALSVRSRSAMRASTARVASTGEACPVRYRCKSSVAVQSARLGVKRTPFCA